MFSFAVSYVALRSSAHVRHPVLGVLPANQERLRSSRLTFEQLEAPLQVLQLLLRRHGILSHGRAYLANSAMQYPGIQRTVMHRQKIPPAYWRMEATSTTKTHERTAVQKTRAKTARDPHHRQAVIWVRNMIDCLRIRCRHVAHLPTRTAWSHMSGAAQLEVIAT